MLSLFVLKTKPNLDLKSDQSLGSNFVKKRSNPEILEIQRTNLKTRPNVRLKLKCFKTGILKI